MSDISKDTSVLDVMIDLIPKILATGIIWKYLKNNLPIPDPIWKLDWKWIFNKYSKFEWVLCDLCTRRATFFKSPFHNPDEQKLCKYHYRKLKEHA
jgi:hypothetical protein